MTEVKRSRSSSLYIRSTPSHQGGMTVRMLRDFVRALDAEGVSDETTVAAQYSIETRHLIALSIRESTTEEVDGQSSDRPEAGDEEQA
jgi:hypothetical protein